MTADRALRLARQVARSVVSGGPYPEGVTEARIVNQVAELLLKVDWRVMPGDETERKDAELFDGQIGLGL